MREAVRRGASALAAVMLISATALAQETPTPLAPDAAATPSLTTQTSATALTLAATPAPALALNPAPPLPPIPGTVLGKGTPAVEPLLAQPPAKGTALAQLAVYFALMIAVLAGGFYVLRHGMHWFQPKTRGPRKLEISETRMLGNRQFLVVAEYENRKMLIGVCPGRIDFLCTLSEPQFPQIAPEEEA